MLAITDRPNHSAEPTSDHGLMTAVVALSSSAPAREVAAAWIAAYDTASAVGAGEHEAEARAHEAYRRAAARLGLLPAAASSAAASTGPDGVAAGTRGD